MRWWERESRLSASRRRAGGSSVRSAPSRMRLAGNKTGPGISCTRSNTRWLQTLGSNAGAAMTDCYETRQLDEELGNEKMPSRKRGHFLWVLCREKDGHR